MCFIKLSLQDRGLVELDSPLIQARKTFNVYDATGKVEFNCLLYRFYIEH